MKLVMKLLLAIWFAAPVAASADAYQDIQDREQLIVGVSIFAPWTYSDRNGDLAGHEIDIARRIAEDLGVDARFELYNFEEVFDALANGEIDIIAAGVAMTAERARRFHFSVPYFSTGVTIATGPSASGALTGVEDFNRPDLTIAVVEDTLAARVVAEQLDAATVSSFSTASGAEGAVMTGRADAYVASVPELRIFSLRSGGTVSLPLDEPLVSGVSGFVVRHEDERLLHFLNSWVYMRQADGFLEDRHRYYFDTLDWAVNMVQQ